MATYVELFTLQTDATLLQRVNTAVLVSAVAIFEESPSTPNHDRRVLWARAVAIDTVPTATGMLKLLLAKFKALTVANIQSSTDATIQAQVDAAVNLFAVGY